MHQDKPGWTNGQWHIYFQTTYPSWEPNEFQLQPSSTFIQLGSNLPRQHFAFYTCLLLAGLFPYSFIHSFIQSVSQSVSQLLISSFIYFFYILLYQYIFPMHNALRESNMMAIYGNWKSTVNGGFNEILNDIHFAHARFSNATLDDRRASIRALMYIRYVYISCKCWNSTSFLLCLVWPLMSASSGKPDCDFHSCPLRRIEFKPELLDVASFLDCSNTSNPPPKTEAYRSVIYHYCIRIW